MILAIDQGTTGTTCLVVDGELQVRGRAYAELPQHFPRPGWVEHDPDEIWASVLAAAEGALADARVRPRELRALGIANQRETTVLWERSTGRPVANAIVWQDRRTAGRCRELPGDRIRELTGLVADPYFSATKLEWLLARHDGDLAFGTVDGWLVWKLTGGRVHAIDETNASRTLLVELASLAWDAELLELFGVPHEVLPAIVPSSGVVAEGELLGATVPIAGIAGDQQAALVAAGGAAKATYGTGAFVLAPAELAPPPRGLVLTAAARAPRQERRYALEGSVFATGAALQWLRDGLALLAHAAESEAMAESIDGTGGVYFVPALAGLGSPHWAPDARGALTGLTGGTGREHVVRAALEATAYQTRDVLEAMPVALERLRADGGQTQNRFAMQFLADLTGLAVEVAAEREQTALGAALLAGLATGVYAAPRATRAGAVYEPRLERDEADRLYAGWREALSRTL